MNICRLSLKSLQARQQNPHLFERRTQCIYLCHVSQMIKSSCGDESYIDSQYVIRQRKELIKDIVLIVQCTKE
jgi:hypothetical protein